MSAAPETVESATSRPSGWLGRIIPVALVVTAAALVGVVAMMPNETPPAPATEIPPVNVKVLRVRAEPELRDTFDLTAVVEADRVVRVASETAGRIERIGGRQREIRWRDRIFPAGATFAEGEPISEGEPIVYLNKDLLQARVDRAQAEFEYARRDYRRILELPESGSTSQTELDDARTKKDIAKAALDEAAAELERTTILAPIGGILNRLPMEIGEYVAPGDCVAEIVDMDPAKVVVDVPERDVHHLKFGDAAEVFVRAPDEGELAGRITYISELADEATRTTRVEITVDQGDTPGLRSGQIARARLTRRILANVIMVPLGAVIPLESGKAVYVVANEDVAERREVELGFIKGRNVHILTGLEVGDRLIIAGHRYVGPGQPVTVIAEN